MRVVAGAAAGWPLAARGQERRVPTIGFLGAGSADRNVRLVASFRQGLADAGFVDDRNVAIDYRWAGGQYDRLPSLAAELVQDRVSLIFASGGHVSALAAQRASSTIPIVFVTSDDPVKAGLVASLSRPGGNVTGVSFIASVVGVKRLELLRELLPKAAVIALLVNPDNPTSESERAGVEAAAGAVGQQLHVASAASIAEIDAAFAAMSGWHADALLVSSDPLFFSERQRLVALAARAGIPAAYGEREFVADGGLMSHGSSITDAYRAAGVYAGRILHGANPADLPVAQSAKFELVINLDAAKALALAVPPALLARADEVIE